MVLKSSEPFTSPPPVLVGQAGMRFPLGGVVVGVVLGVVTVSLITPVIPPLASIGAAVGGAIAVSTAVIFLWVFRGHKNTLKYLQRGLRRARDGNLQPLSDVPDPHNIFLRELLDDYNRTINTLRTMFSEVEECQNRVLGERNRMNVLIQSLPGALLGVNDELCVNAVNKLTEDYFGMSSHGMIGRNLFDLIALDDAEREILRDAFLYKTEICNQELNLHVYDRMRCFSLNLAFLSEEDSDLGAVLTLQDITDYKHLQESVSSREKLVALGQLAGGVAHELNTPLGNILGYAQLLRDGPTDARKSEHYLQVICDETRHCSRIVDELLNYARKDKCVAGLCDINDLAIEVIETLLNCSMKRYNIHLSMDLDPDCPNVAVGCGYVDIVLVNLILNSVHALNGVAEPTITIRTYVDPSPYSVVLSVEDNGPGVPERIRGRIFDPFFTTKEVGEGTGLGLAISQAILAKHEGRIKYDDRYDGGARFIVRLPVASNITEVSSSIS